jgi:hypothetical protein
MKSSDDQAVPVPSEQPKYRMWAVHCPFNKSGFPSLGQFGYTSRDVVIFSMETWTQLCEDIPALATAQFEVGTYD